MRRRDDPWSDDDPAIVRMREALALRPPEALEATETPDPGPAAVETRRERVAALLARVRAGDRTATGLLRSLIERDLP